jgi:hypothetical protein
MIIASVFLQPDLVNFQGTTIIANYWEMNPSGVIDGRGQVCIE